MSLAREAILAFSGRLGNSYLALEEGANNVFLPWEADGGPSFCCFRSVWKVDKKGDLYEKPLLNNPVIDKCFHCRGC